MSHSLSHRVILLGSHLYKIDSDTKMVTQSAQRSVQIYYSTESLPYFLGYKTECFLFFQNKTKDLELSYKMDPDFRDCLERVKLVL